ncbi:MAG: hypothetical protein ACTH54_00425 [Vagococcus salmoninarum]|uniref:hypothetical protein n=1 Tax=Vagococcus salmoninarum TaxID=2739 RepID=UPI003F96CE4D
MIELIEIDWENDKSIDKIKRIYCKSIKTVLGKIAKEELEYFNEESKDSDKDKSSIKSKLSDKEKNKVEENIKEQLKTINENLSNCVPGLDLKKLILLSHKDLMDLKNSDKLPKENFEFFPSIYNKLINNKLNLELVDSLNIKVCPYCNLNYINDRVIKKNGKDRKRSSAEIDHFIDKGTYPVYSICLNNLIPACSKCNHIKGSEKFSISPYSIKDEQNYFKLSIGEKNNFTLNSVIPELQVQNDLLGIEEYYSIHQTLIDDYVKRNEIYSELKLKEMNQILDRHNYDIDDFVFGTIVESIDDKKNALSKFRRDIIKQIK